MVNNQEGKVRRSRLLRETYQINLPLLKTKESPRIAHAEKTG